MAVHVFNSQEIGTAEDDAYRRDLTINRYYLDMSF